MRIVHIVHVHGDVVVESGRTTDLPVSTPATCADTWPGDRDAVDGVNNNSTAFKSGGTSFFATVPPRLDAIEEINVTTAGLGADAGAEGAMNILFVTKRGTNAFHGGGFTQVVNEGLNANSYFNNALNLVKPRARRTEFGGSLGGPIIRNKAFRGERLFQHHRSGRRRAALAHQQHLWQRRAVAQRSDSEQSRLERTAEDLGALSDRAGRLSADEEPHPQRHHQHLRPRHPGQPAVSRRWLSGAERVPEHLGTGDGIDELDAVPEHAAGRALRHSAESGHLQHRRAAVGSSISAAA